MSPRSVLKGTALALAALAAAFGAGLTFTGCSSGSAPTDRASPPLAPAEIADGRVFVAFSSQALARAAKAADFDDGGRTDSRLVSPHGPATIGVSGDDWLVSLSVPKGAVAEPTVITVSVFGGDRLSDLVVGLAPAGLRFKKKKYATLTITVARELVDIPLSDIEAYHLFQDGTVVLARILSIRLDADGRLAQGVGKKRKSGDEDDDWESLTIDIEVSGFSRYGVQNSD